MDHPTDNSVNFGPDRQADDRLIHALLLHLHDGQAAQHRERRVRRAMQAIHEPAERGTPCALSSATVRSVRTSRFPVWAKHGLWAAAAMAIIAVGIGILTYKPTPAAASLNDILGALGRPGDRTYRVQMQDLPAPPERRPPDDRPPENVPRPGLDGATLYLRDGTQYVLVRKDPNGGVIYDGYDGRQSWRVRRGEVAETKEGLGAGGIPMPPIMANVPFADLHQTLARIRVDYTVQQFDQTPLPSGGDLLQHVLVRRNSRQVKGPNTIEIWADPKSGMPKRIIFDDAKVQGNHQPCRITLDLASEAQLPAKWFDHQLHVAGAASGTP